MYQAFIYNRLIKMIQTTKLQLERNRRSKNLDKYLVKLGHLKHNMDGPSLSSVSEVFIARSRLEMLTCAVA